MDTAQSSSGTLNGVTMIPRLLMLEGRGKVTTIQDVSLSNLAEAEKRQLSSPLFTNLKREKQRTENALARRSKSLAALEGYIGSLSADNLQFNMLNSATEAYNSTAEKVDEKIMKLKVKLGVLETEVGAEEMRLVNGSSPCL
ncbi:hypothetical protein C0991_004984 [Blastosporella zonata]|nr:hypothetical protein C0991_004984 [Blastosporella zonata]